MESVEPLITHPLAYVRKRRGWSAAMLLHRVADVAEADLRLRLPTDDRGKVSRWETRGVVPEPAVQRAIARLLRVPESARQQAPWPRWLPAFDGVHPVRAWSPPHTVRALADAVRGGPADPRAYLALTGPALVAVAQRWLDRRPPRLVAVVRGGPRAGEAALSGLEHQLRTLHSIELTLSPAVVTDLAGAQLHLCLELLRRGSCTSEAARRVHRAAAHHALLAGWAAFDSGRHFSAQRLLIAAAHAAHGVHDRPLAAYALMSLGLQALVLGHRQPGLRVTQLALAGVPRGPERALLAAYRGLALLAVGRDPDAVQQAVRRAQRPVTAAPAPQPFTGVPIWGVWGSVPADERRYLVPLAGGPVAAIAATTLLVPCVAPTRTHHRLQQLAEQLADTPRAGWHIGEQLRTLGRPAA